jgi:hypothetical protein
VGTKQAIKAPPLPENERKIPMGRAVFGVVGLRRVLEPGELKVTRGEFDQAVDLERDLRDVVYRFVAGEKETAEALPTYDHDATLALLFRSMDEGELENNLRQFQGHPQGDEFIRAASEAAAFLKTKAPRRNRATWTTPKPMPPSRAEVGPWRRYLESVGRPLWAVKQLLGMTLAREHVEALAAVWPEVLEVVTKAYEDAKADQLERDPSWQPTRRQGRILSILIGKDPTAPAELIQAFQQAFANERKQQEQQAAQGDAPDSKLSTTVQQVASTSPASR